MTKQKIEIEIDVPEGCEFVKMDMMKIDGINCYVPAFKEVTPVNQIIDLSFIVGSGIDCEFSADGVYWFVGQLEKILKFSYLASDGGSWEFCRIRQSPRVHFWQGGDKCPLPEGLEVRINYLIEGVLHSVGVKDYVSSSWAKVIAFEILGTAPGWRYEWEKE